MKFFTCRHVLDKFEPVRVITHDRATEEYPHESWSAVCGADQSNADGKLVDDACFWALPDVMEAERLPEERSMVRYDPGHGWTERAAYSNEPIRPNPLPGAVAA